jgi:hypothetical protein
MLAVVAADGDDLARARHRREQLDVGERGCPRELARGARGGHACGHRGEPLRPGRQQPQHAGVAQRDAAQAEHVRGMRRQTGRGDEIADVEHPAVDHGADAGHAVRAAMAHQLHAISRGLNSNSGTAR